MFTQQDLDEIQTEAQMLAEEIVNDFMRDFLARPSQVMYGPQSNWLQQQSPSFGFAGQEAQISGGFGEQAASR